MHETVYKPWDEGVGEDELVPRVNDVIIFVDFVYADN